MNKLTLQDVKDLLLGSAVLGTGGGGSLERGYNIAEEIFRRNGPVKLLDLEDLPDDGIIASPYFCGSVSSVETDEDSSSFFPDEALEAFETLEKHLNSSFYGTLPTEIGGSNTAVALAVGAQKNIPVIDADPAGRSVPELQHTTFFVEGLSIYPLATVNDRGDMLILDKGADDFFAEEIVRKVAVAGEASAGVADHPLNGSQLKNSLINGSLTKALKIGKSIQKARNQGGNPVSAALEPIEGYLLFEGEVEQASWREEDGFTVGEIEIVGREKYRGSNYKIKFKNEHIISWKDDEVDVTVPDLISILESDSAEPVTNPNCQKGMQVSVVGYPSPAIWRKTRGLEVLGPGHFGYEVDYRPLEEIPRLAESQ